MSRELIILIQKILMCPKCISYHILIFFQPLASPFKKISGYTPLIWFSLLHGSNMIPYFCELEKHLMRNFVFHEIDMQKWLYLLRRIEIQQQHPVLFFFDLITTTQSSCCRPIREYSFVFFSIYFYQCFQNKSQSLTLLFILLKWSKEAQDDEPFLFGDVVLPEVLIEFLASIDKRLNENVDLHKIICQFIYNVWLKPKSGTYISGEFEMYPYTYSALMKSLTNHPLCVFLKFNQKKNKSRKRKYNKHQFHMIPETKRKNKYPYNCLYTPSCEDCLNLSQKKPFRISPLEERGINWATAFED